jgi:hypothetical protein
MFSGATARAVGRLLVVVGLVQLCAGGVLIFDGRASNFALGMVLMSVVWLFLGFATALGGAPRR